MIWTKLAWKRFESYGMENQIFLHQFMDLFDQILLPNHSHINTKRNPSDQRLEAAPYTKKQTWIFCLKIENWKQGYKVIQAAILIPLACWGFREGIWIKTTSFHPQKRENDLTLYRKYFTFLHLDSCIFHNFLCLICLHYMILMLTI